MIGRECSLNIKKGYRLQWEEAQAGWVILFPEGMIQLNDTAAMILRQFQQPTVVHEAITKLEATFPGEEIQNDIFEFLEDACEQQWLEPTQ